MSANDVKQKRVSLESVPGRLLIDTSVLNVLYEEGEYIWEGVLPVNIAESDLDDDLIALRWIFAVNNRAFFQFVVSPLTVAEIANIQDFYDRSSLLSWVLEVLECWQIQLDESGDRLANGGTVRHRFKLSPELQNLEEKLEKIPDLRRDPFDRLLLIHSVMTNCDAFLTNDRNSIWRHRKTLSGYGINVIRPSEYWTVLKPWAAIWL